MSYTAVGVHFHSTRDEGVSEYGFRKSLDEIGLNFEEWLNTPLKEKRIIAARLARDYYDDAAEFGAECGMSILYKQMGCES